MLVLIIADAMMLKSFPHTFTDEQCLYNDNAKFYIVSCRGCNKFTPCYLMSLQV